MERPPTNFSNVLIPMYNINSFAFEPMYICNSNRHVL